MKKIVGILVILGCAFGTNAQETVQSSDSSLVNDSCSLDSSVGISFICSTPTRTHFFQEGVRVFPGLILLRNLIENPNHCSEYTLKSVTLRQLPTRNLQEIAALAAGVIKTNSGLSFRGSREDGTAYYQDGVRLIDAPKLLIGSDRLSLK